MPISDDQRKAWGFLGPVPPEVLGAKSSIVKRYKALAEEAKRVVRWQEGPVKEKAAKGIERRFYELIEEARKNQA